MIDIYDYSGRLLGSWNGDLQSLQAMLSSGQRIQQVQQNQSPNKTDDDSLLGWFWMLTVGWLVLLFYGDSSDIESTDEMSYTSEIIKNDDYDNYYSDGDYQEFDREYPEDQTQDDFDDYSDNTGSSFSSAVSEPMVPDNFSDISSEAGEFISDMPDTSLYNEGSCNEY